ncbi:MAG TPA: SDR family NAD(P)-dependent oxidoreductase [Blastocatellia bacterium]|nr:SDR family NAD(P)-dependent oxidoreductase [Blastocatellia bacterium]
MSASWLAGKSVLITGASGTVGSGLLRAILETRPKVVRALDHHEHGLFELRQQVGEDDKVRWLLGDIRDGGRLRRAMEGIDVVFHAAALKHVSIGEYNPFEVVQTNLYGLQNIVQAALDTNVERVIFTSSDKAVNPTNAMGASKLMGERLILAAQGMAGTSRTRFASVRFGNIIGSNGSVTTIFRSQISQGGPVTLTDRRMTRFVMGLDQAVRLVLRAAEMAVGGELFVLKMPTLRIEELAEVMINRLAPAYGYLPGAIKVKEIGARTGEKLYEELLMEAEVPRACENDEYIVYVGEEMETSDCPYLREMRPVSTVYHSDYVPHMTKPQIEEFLETIGFLEQRKAAEVNS